MCGAYRDDDTVRRMEPQHVCVHRSPKSTAEASESVPNMHQQLWGDAWELPSWKHVPRLKESERSWQKFQSQRTMQ